MLALLFTAHCALLVSLSLAHINVNCELRHTHTHIMNSNCEQVVIIIIKLYFVYVWKCDTYLCAMRTHSTGQNGWMGWMNGWDNETCTYSVYIVRVKWHRQSTRQIFVSARKIISLYFAFAYGSGKLMARNNRFCITWSRICGTFNLSTCSYMGFGGIAIFFLHGN